MGQVKYKTTTIFSLQKALQWFHLDSPEAMYTNGTSAKDIHYQVCTKKTCRHQPSREAEKVHVQV